MNYLVTTFITNSKLTTTTILIILLFICRGLGGEILAWPFTCLLLRNYRGQYEWPTGVPGWWGRLLASVVFLVSVGLGYGLKHPGRRWRCYRSWGKTDNSKDRDIGVPQACDGTNILCKMTCGGEKWRTVKQTYHKQLYNNPKGDCKNITRRDWKRSKGLFLCSECYETLVLGSDT